MRKLLQNGAVILGTMGAVALFIFCGFISVAHAADVTVAPAVIDAHGLPRDMMHYDLTVTNTTGRLVNVFASVHELTADGQQIFTDPSISDRPALLVDWMEVTRGAITLQAGESRTVSVDISVNPFATSGIYHAVIAFVEGSTRDEAEQHLTGAPQTLVTMNVASNAKELLQVDDFSTAKRFYSGFPIAFHYTVRNAGDVPSVPAGVILFYDRLGREIGSVDANQAGVGIAPGEKHDFAVSWDNGPSFGQYKAVLDLTYGATGAKMEKIVLLWILPWQKILIIFVMLLIVVVVAAVFLHRAYERRHYRHRRIAEHPVRDHKVIDLRHPHHD